MQFINCNKCPNLNFNHSKTIPKPNLNTKPNLSKTMPKNLTYMLKYGVCFHAIHAQMESVSFWSSRSGMPKYGVCDRQTRLAWLSKMLTHSVKL